MVKIWFCGSDGQVPQPPEQSIAPYLFGLIVERPVPSVPRVCSYQSTIDLRRLIVTDRLHPTCSRAVLLQSLYNSSLRPSTSLASISSLGKLLEGACGNGAVIFGLVSNHSFDRRLANQTGLLQQFWSPRCRHHFRL